MRLCDGRRVPLVRLKHMSGGGAGSTRAGEEIAARVATLSRLLAEASTTAR
jgi:acetyl-CoA carboxylase carboxyltransferase component